MLKKTIKYLVIFLLICSTIIFVYLNQLFGKKIKESEVKEFVYENSDTNFKIRFFGTMCFYLEYDGKAILTDPFFSNPNPLELLHCSSIDKKYLNFFSPDELGKINMIAIGHAHYDHCLELPLFINNSKPIDILGSHSLANLFQKKYPNNNYIIGEDYVANKKWFYNQDSSIRVYFMLSKHGPHFGKTVLMNGENLPQNEPPKNLLEWQCGKSMSYIIDFMKQDSIAKRIVLNGGKTDFPSTSFDSLIVKQHNADLVLLIGWNKTELLDKFKMFDLFEPPVIILAHWNNFFNSKNGDHEYIRKSDLPNTLKSINHSSNKFKTLIMLPETLKK